MSPASSPDASAQTARLARAIAALETVGTGLGAEVLETALAPLRAQLAALRRGARRRQATVLFLDIVGSSALVRCLDPEDVHRALDGALAAFAAVVRAHGGEVLQYAGDGLLAVYGGWRAREDDAERAVLSGLALLAAARTERSRLAAAFGPGSEAAAFDVRVGINTGTVLIGAGPLGESSIRGHAVNVAARMEQSAPAGGLRIAHATWRLARGRFDVLAEAPRRLKAHDEPLVSYLVRGERPVAERRTARGLDGIALPLVGRADELERLRALAIDVRGGSGLGVAWLGGDAGIGKTRLADEFEDELRAAGWLLLHGTAQPAAVAAPYALWREPVARLLEMAAVAGGPVVQGLAADAAESPGADPDTVALDAVFLRHLFGLGPQQAADADRAAATGALAPFAGDAEALRERALQALWRLVERACGVGRPVLLRFEDLHWADEASLDLIGRLVERGAALSLLVVATSRPAAEAAHSAALESAFAQAAVQRVELAPLAGDALEALADRLAAQRGEAAPALRARLVGEGQGNPFFMEELAAVALAQPSQTPDASAVPATLNAVLLARVDALPDAQRRALLAASIVGPVFEAGALAAVDEGARDALAALLERGLVRRPAGVAVAGRDGEAFEFRHQLLQQAAYDLVLRETRRRGHAAVARWIAAQAPPRPELSAPHRERAGEIAGAIDDWHAAAVAARARWANADAARDLRRALALVPDDAPRRRFELLLLLEDTCLRLVDRAAVGSCVEALRALAGNLDDAARLAAGVRHAIYLFDGGDAAASLASAEALLAQADPAAWQERVRLHSLAQAAHARQGHYGDAGRHAEAGLALARAHGDRLNEAKILNQLGMDALEQGQHLPAESNFEAALALHRELGHRGNVAASLGNLGYIAWTLGDAVAARALFEDARALAREIRQPLNEGLVEVNLSLVHAQAGDAAAALASARAAIALLAPTGDRWAEAAARRQLGHALLLAGDAAAARSEFRAAREAFDALGLGAAAAEAGAGLALASQQAGDDEAARAEVEALLARGLDAERLSGADEPLRVLQIAWELLAAAGDERAPALLAAALAALEQRAARIGDAARRERFLRAVPAHRALLDAAAAMPAALPPATARGGAATSPAAAS